MLSTENWRVDFNERYPIYQQIIHHFSRSIVKGDLLPGNRIPSIRELSMVLKVNTNTVQRAYSEMERDKLIYAQRGTGYFVMENKQIVGRVKNEMVTESISRFLDEMDALGFNNTEILSEIEKKLTERSEGLGIDNNKRA